LPATAVDVMKSGRPILSQTQREKIGRFVCVALMIFRLFEMTFAADD
jgi:hypothetical protein